MPPPEPLKGAELVAFRAQTAPAMARIQGMEKLIYADASPAPAAESASTEVASAKDKVPAGRKRG